MRKLFFSLCILLFLLFTINNIYAQDTQINIQDKVILKETSKTIPITVYNNSQEIKWYNIEAYTSPFETQIQESYFYVDSYNNNNNSKTIYLTISPLQKSLTSVYLTHIQISSDNYTKKIPLTIVQESNIYCFVEIVDNFINYDLNNSKYILDLKLENTSEFSQEIFVKQINDVNKTLLDISQEHEVLGKDVLWLSYVLDVNSLDIVYVNYTCNDVIQKIKEISVPKEKEPQQKNTFGLFVLSSAKSFYNSVLFQVVLIVVLIFLVLSFTTRYIRYLYKK
jgi:hypothetical protein